jgi:hypothetical protein
MNYNYSYIKDWNPTDIVFSSFQWYFWIWFKLRPIYSFLNLRICIKELSCWKDLRMLQMSVKWKLSMHKQLWVICKLFNDCYHWMVFTWTLFLMYVLVRGDLFVFVRFRSKILVPSRMFVGFTSLEGFVVVLVFNTIEGRIYHLWRRMPDEWSKRTVYLGIICWGRNLDLVSVSIWMDGWILWTDIFH